METVALWISYLIKPWIKESASDILIFIAALQLLIVLVWIFRYRRKDNLASTLLLFSPSFAIFMSVIVYWYVLAFYYMLVYPLSYNEIKDNKEFRETWQKNIKLSVALTVALPVITIIVCEFLGFGYKLFP